MSSQGRRVLVVLKPLEEKEGGCQEEGDRKQDDRALPWSSLKVMFLEKSCRKPGVVPVEVELQDPGEQESQADHERKGGSSLARSC